MSRAHAVSLSVVLLSLLVLVSPLSSADVVIESNPIELLESGDFSDPDEWTITSKKTFTNNPADYSVGMIADGELSFTHSRPSNFQTVNSWATTSPTDSSSSTGAPDGYYDWSKGPDITTSGYIFTGLDNLEIANVSLILHLEVPEELPSDEIRVIIEVDGVERLVSTIARTFGPLDRMTTPLVISMDNLEDWTWDLLESSSVTVDYVSDGAPDDSEVRVDAIGIRVTHHQPWFSFETVKAQHSIIGNPMPVLDYGPYDGTIHGLSVDSCGLTPNGGTQGTWDFNVEVPYDQELGRIHIFGEGNFTIEAMPQGHTSMENFQTYDNGELLSERDVTNSVRITIYDGCIEMARIDVNDPFLEVIGTISGSVNGLADGYSDVKFAIGETLVNSIPITTGQFVFQIPIGHALPSSEDELLVGVAARFQWSSNGTPETTVVHIDSMSIEGGYNLLWDYDVTCSPPEEVTLQEDGGGVLISMASRCEDDLTQWQDLVVQVFTGDNQILEASVINGDIRIQPMNNANGITNVEVNVIDENGNVWEGAFNVIINPVEDSPTISGLPISTYIELGSTKIIDVEISDPDSPIISQTTSRSWATFDESGALVLEPIEPGVHNLVIFADDGNYQVNKSIEVIVTAKPDLVVEDIEVWYGSTSVDIVNEGDVVQIKVLVRNEGRVVANAFEIRCRINEVLIGSSNIDTLLPGEMKIVTCDTRVESSGLINLKAIVDVTASIDETNENNNEFSKNIESLAKNNGESKDKTNNIFRALVIASIALIAISFVTLQFGPGRIVKPYRKRK